VKKRLGELLLEKRLIDVDQLSAALAHQRQWGVRLGVSLVAMGFIAEGTLVQALADGLGLPLVDLSKVVVDKKALALVPDRVCEASEVFPIAVRELTGGRSTLLLAMADPQNTAAIDEVAFLSDCIVKTAIAPTSSIEQAIQRHLRGRRVEIAPISFEKRAVAAVVTPHSGQHRELPDHDFIDELSDPGRPAPPPSAPPAPSLPSTTTSPSQRFRSQDMPAPAAPAPPPAVPQPRTPSQAFATRDPWTAVPAAPMPSARAPSSSSFVPPVPAPITAEDPWAAIPAAPLPAARVPTRAPSATLSPPATTRAPSATLSPPAPAPPARAPSATFSSPSTTSATSLMDQATDPFAILDGFSGMPTGVFLMPAPTPPAPAPPAPTPLAPPASTTNTATSAPMANDQQVLDELERKYWGLMRVLHRRGHVTREEFVAELGDD
jgi:hypothetical protein